MDKEKNGESSSLLKDNLPVVTNNLPSGPDILHESPPGVQRVFRSEIWEHVTPYWVKHKSYEKDKETKKLVEKITWKMRAKCKYCPKGQGDYACESGPNGTGGPRKHIFNKQCRFYPGNVDIKKQKVLAPGDYNLLTTKAFNQKETMEACVEMVVLDELPFSFVEKEGFRRFCNKGMPLFKIPSRRTLVRTFLDMYGDKKMILRKELSEKRVCLTTDTWTSVQNYNYMVLTAHFIDLNWKMHKRVLNFCVITNHQGITIADLVEQCLNDWGIDKVMTITVGNASANQTALDVLRGKLNTCEYPQPILEGKHMHVRCVAHITNLIVGSGLKKLNLSILSIRNAVKFARSSPHRFELFKKAVAREKLPYKGLVCLDLPTRWNSTYLMLESALRLKRAFKRMEQDPSSQYVAYFSEPEEEYDDEGNEIVVKKGKKKVGPQIKDDWEKCDVFVNFLKVFYEVTLRVSASLHPTIHTTFHDIITIEQTMNQLLALPTLVHGPSTNRLMAEIGSLMKQKYKKYFGDFKNLNPFVIVGLVLDPRFKLKHVSHVLKTVLGWSDHDVFDKEYEIKTLMFSLYDEYSNKLNGDKPLLKRNQAENIESSVKKQKTTIHGISSANRFVMDWTRHVGKSNEAIITHEVNKYLEDPLESIGNKIPTEDEEGVDIAFNEEDVESEYKLFDVLDWWKHASAKYLVLALVARHVFAIQVSTVASESAFSTGGRIIDSFRSSLTPTSVEALICMQNWLRGDNILTQFEDEPCTEELEFYESIETCTSKLLGTVMQIFIFKKIITFDLIIVVIKELANSKVGGSSIDECK